MESSIQIEDRAAAWLAKRDSGDWTAVDEDSFARWLEASTANRVAYLRLEAAWEAAERLQVFAAGTYSPNERQQRPFFEEPHSTSPSHSADPSQEPHPPQRGASLSAPQRGVVATLAHGEELEEPHPSRERGLRPSAE